MGNFSGNMILSSRRPWEKFIQSEVDLEVAICKKLTNFEIFLHFCDFCRCFRMQKRSQNAKHDLFWSRDSQWCFFDHFPIHFANGLIFVQKKQNLRMGENSSKKWGLGISRFTNKKQRISSFNALTYNYQLLKAKGSLTPSLHNAFLVKIKHLLKLSVIEDHVKHTYKILIFLMYSKCSIAYKFKIAGFGYLLLALIMITGKGKNLFLKVIN